MKSVDFPAETEFYELDNLPVAVLPSGEVLNCFGKPKEAPESVSRQVLMGLASGLTSEEFDQLVARKGGKNTSA